MWLVDLDETRAALTCMAAAGAAVIQQAPAQRVGGSMAAPLLAGGVGLLAGAAPAP